MRHLVVSESGDPHGFVDERLAAQGRRRRVALTVPNFMFALAVVAETDLISALPKRFVAMHAARFGVRGLDAPLSLPDFRLNAVAPKVAMMDSALAWLFKVLEETEAAAQMPRTSAHAEITAGGRMTTSGSHLRTGKIEVSGN